MEDLILRVQSTNLETTTNFASNPLQAILNIMAEVESSLMSTKSDEELLPVYQKVESFNIFIQERVNFNPEIYSDNYILQNTSNEVRRIL